MPQHVWQFFDPLSFGFLKLLLDPIRDCLVGGFGLPVALRVAWCRVVELNLQLLQQIFNIFTNERRSVVQYECFGDAELGQNVPSDKPHHVHLPDLVQWLGLHPLCEVVYCC